MEGSKQLTDIRVLVVEDEPVVAMGIADQLSAAGAVIVGPCATARGAIDVLQGNDVDAAVIDFVLADKNSESLQVALERKGVPSWCSRAIRLFWYGGRRANKSYRNPCLPCSFVQPSKGSRA